MTIFSIATFAVEYSGRGLDYESEPIGLDNMPGIIAFCAGIAVIGGLLYWFFKDKAEEDNPGCTGCLGMGGIGLLIIAGLGAFAVGWELLNTFILTPILYTVTYVISLVFKLALGLLAISIIPGILYGLVETQKEKIGNGVYKFLAGIAIIAGLSADIFLFSLLPKNTITVETFFPEWTLDEQIDMRLHPERYEYLDEEDDDDNYDNDSSDDEEEEDDDY